MAKVPFYKPSKTVNWRIPASVTLSKLAPKGLYRHSPSLLRPGRAKQFCLIKDFFFLGKFS